MPAFDESSCIKHYNSGTLRDLLAAFRETPFRLAASALVTRPAPLHASHGGARRSRSTCQGSFERRLLPLPLPRREIEGQVFEFVAATDDICRVWNGRGGRGADLPGCSACARGHGEGPAREAIQRALVSWALREEP